MELRTILLAVGSEDEERIESLAETAIAIAGPADATVGIAHVFTPEEYETVRTQLNIGPETEETPDTVAKRHHTIREISAMCDDAGVVFSCHGAVGSAGEQILELSDTLHADMAIVGGRKRSPTGKAVFGSTAQQVMMNAPCPVTFVRGRD
jgi:nucleotide-binding universal stress UspA family protein